MYIKKNLNEYGHAVKKKEILVYKGYAQNIHSLPLIRDNLVWRINDGMTGRIGLDPWSGCGGRHILSRELISYLQDHGIQHFAHIADQKRTDILSQAWKTPLQLQLPPQWHQEWR